MGRGSLDGRGLVLTEGGEGLPRFRCFANRSEASAMGMMGDSRIEEVALLLSKQTHTEVVPIIR